MKKISGIEKNYSIRNTKLNHNQSVNDRSDETALKFTSQTLSEVEDVSYSQHNEVFSQKSKKSNTQKFSSKKN